jgi:hypothetical protein
MQCFPRMCNPVTFDGDRTASIRDEFKKVHHSDVPTFLLSGSIDFSTAAEYATDQLLPQLKYGKQVILKEMGHTHDLWNVQRSAAVGLITGFFDTGVVDESMFTFSQVNFHVKLDFPIMAKAGLVFIFLILVALLFSLCLLIKHIHHKRSAQA